LPLAATPPCPYAPCVGQVAHLPVSLLSRFVAADGENAAALPIRETLMKLSSALSMTCLAIVVSFGSRARAEKPNLMEKMVGKWEATTGPIKGAIFEFGKDGSLKLAVNGMNLEGKFKVVSPEVVEFTLQDKTSKVPYKFEKEILNLTDPEGNAVKLSRLK
jgi:hypothetical protein